MNILRFDVRVTLNVPEDNLITAEGRIVAAEQWGELIKDWIYDNLDEELAYVSDLHTPPTLRDVTWEIMR